MTPVIRRKLQDGRALTVGIGDQTGDYRAEVNGLSVGLVMTGIESIAEIDGKYGTDKLVAAMRAAGRTHVLGRTVTLTADEAEQLKTALTHHLATDPRALRCKREALKSALSGWIETAGYEQERRIERAGETGHLPRKIDRTAEIEAAQTALDAFDTAHPEVLASHKSTSESGAFGLFPPLCRLSRPVTSSTRTKP